MSIKKAYFNIDGSDYYEGYYDKNVRWNGWAIPFFEKDIADTFTGERERFRIGIADNSVPIIFCKIRHLHPAVYQFAVRLVRDEINRLFVLGGFLFEQSRQFFDRFLAVHHAARIVGRIDEYGGRLFVQCAFQQRKIDLEGVGVGSEGDEFCSRRFRKDFVFGEVRGKGDDFILRIAERTKADGE